MNRNASNPLFLALLNPLNLAMLALVAAAALCSAWWLLPVGLALWLVMIIAIARSPELQLSHKLEARAALSPRFQARFNRLERVQINLYNALQGAAPAIRRILQPLQDDISLLVEQAHALCLRASTLDHYRQTSESGQDLEAEWVRLSAEIEKAQDQRLRNQYQGALQSLEKRLAQRKEIQARLEAVEAVLTASTSDLEAITSELLSLQALGQNQVRAELPRLRAAVKEEQRQLQSISTEMG